MSHELDKAYNPSKYEPEIYAQWEDSGAFKPDLKAKKDPFTIIMPPPNANGHIHMGTAMFVIEDIMIRYRRMQGHPTLWLPGTDHAGIETQVVYERLLAGEGKSRFDFTREQFYADVMKFTRSNQSTIINELRSLGFSADWSRLQFTLDDKIVATVYDTFRELHDQGLIYRANRIVNWCPHCRSAFADIEVKHRDQVDPLYYIKYGPFVLATVRPETKFGDTAIAVNPKDERYAKYIGKTIEAEDLNGPIHLKVIADPHIDPAFGTGAMKVTPAHDHNDWEIGLRHNLEVKQVIGTDGLLTELAGRYAGMPIVEARTQVARDLEERGLMDHVDMNYTHSIGIHDRCGTPIEPLVVEQWWLKVDELKKPAIAAIKSGEVKFVPERFTKIALDWLENLHDWNISRQNWWGIRVPVYYNAGSDTTKPAYIIAIDESEAIATYGAGNYEAETDNFDTWFSSGQWPYATTMATGDFERGFYPTSVMETGRDILFLWVTRMIMFGLFKTGQVPFKTIYLHGLVTDGTGKKMSKSKGNVINPLDMTSKYGTDALRLALTIGITAGNDGPLSESKIEGYRNFNNKLWNVARFILGQLPDNYSPTAPKLHSPADHWMLAKLNAAVNDVTSSIEDYRFSEAGQLIYALLWDDFADWYLEASKISPNHDLLTHGLQTILQLIHPIAPFVSEAIWSELPWQSTQLITTPWPVVDITRTKADLSRQQIREFDEVVSIVREIRTTRAELSLDKATVVYIASPFWAANGPLIARLSRNLELKQADQSKGLLINSSQTKAWLAADDKTIAQTITRLTAQLNEKRTYMKGLEAKLGNASYLASAPAKIVGETRERHAETLALIKKLETQLSRLN
ncbi:MAG TPA: valine--tRNA ligase [Candidatus Saccharimonadia bacterium]|nr:valine--tRNA ligase [Candidatus Saccharimonadia bacterium]